MRRPFLVAVYWAATTLSAQPGAVVTDTLRIRIDGKLQTARKINGRWWSQDNRELRRTSTEWLWAISGGNARHLVRFDHHYPFDPSKLGQVDRSMGPAQVRSTLGDPNSVFPSDKPEQLQHWDYYGANGYKLSIMFSSSGNGIFTASYEADAHAKLQDVPHLTFRFQGKTARENFEERKAGLGARRAGLGGTTVPVARAVASPPTMTRKLTAAEVESVTAGMGRPKLIELLGDPMSRSAITDGDGVRETLRYVSEGGLVITIVVVDGKVTEIRK